MSNTASSKNTLFLLAFVSAIVFLIIGLPSVAFAADADVVSFPDANLKQALVDAGVDTSGDGNITQGEMAAVSGALYLDRKGLTDISGLQFAQNITTLSINLNKVTDLQCLGSLPKLNTIYAYGNKIIDLSKIPVFQAIKYIDIAGNPFADFTGMPSIPGLEKLRIGYNFPEFSLNGLPGLSGLKELTIESVSVNDLSPLSNVPNLEVLEFSECTIASLQSLPSLLHLKKLNIDGITIDTTSMPDLPALEELDIGASNISGLYHAPNLKKLSLIVNNADFGVLSQLSSLDTLTLDLGARADISTMPDPFDVETLNIKSGIFSDVSKLPDMPRLKTLDLSGNKISTLNGFPDTPMLESLTIRDNELTSLSGLPALSKLKILVVEYNSISSLNGMPDLPKLELFNIGGNVLTDLNGFTQSGLLKTLYLRNNLLTDISALPALPELVTLDISSNQITDISCLQLDTKLQTLRLNGNKVSSLAQLSGMNMLKTLEFDQNKVTSIQPIVNLTSLTSISMWDNMVADITGLDNLVDLQSLMIWDNWLDGTSGSVDDIIMQNVKANGTFVSWGSQSQVQARLYFNPLLYGTMANDFIDANYGQHVVLPAAVSTNPYYEFAGWDYTGDGSKDYDGGQTIVFPIDDFSDERLTAVYSEIDGKLGTSSNPYLISTAAELNDIRNYQQAGAHFKLTADIDLSQLTSAGGDYYHNGEGWEPIGTAGVFYGIFDGGGHTISGLNINNTDDLGIIGLFGEIASGAEVHDLTLTQTSVAGTYKTGGFAGSNSGRIYNCTNTGAVGLLNSGISSGGIAGENKGEIFSCRNTGRVVNSNGSAGGIAGENQGSINTCYNTGYIWGGGGIAGNHIGGSIKNCYNAGNIGGDGIASDVRAPVQYCYNVGNVTSGGGIAAADQFHYISDCFSIDTAKVSGIPGVVYLSSGDLSSQVAYAGFDFDNIWTIGGAGYPYPRLIAAPNIEKPQDTEHFAGGNGMAYSPYIVSTPRHFDEIRNNNGAWFELDTDIDFTDAMKSAGAFYNEGAGWIPIGTQNAPFFGIIDGKGHTVTGIMINRPEQDFTGVFAYVNGNSQIKNIHFIQTDVKGRGKCGGIIASNRGTITGCSILGKISGSTMVGGIAAYNLGSITGCVNHADVSGVNYIGGINGMTSEGAIQGCINGGKIDGTCYVGGISGYQEGDSKIQKCYNAGAIKASADTGGIAGWNEGGIEDCFNIGLVHASGYHSGIVGLMHLGNIKHCLNLGSIYDSYNAIAGIMTNGNITECYYFNGMNTAYSIGGTVTDCYGKTEAELKLKNTYEGFNFDTVWSIEEGVRYPVLRGVPFNFTTGIALNETSLTLNKNDTDTLLATVTPANATNKNIRWTTDDAAVAVVDQAGKITAKGPGTVEIHATTQDGGFTASCAVQIAVRNVKATFDSRESGYTQTFEVPEDSLLAKPTGLTRNGFTLTGWYKESSLTNLWDFENDRITLDMALYAKWMPDCKITFDYKGMYETTTQNMAYGTKITAPAVPERADYDFGGWFLNIACTQPWNFNNKVTQDTGLYAKWTVRKYKVTIDKKDGTAPAEQQIDYNLHILSPDPDPTRTGYDFAGWFQNEACTQVWDFNNPIIKDTTLYAKWDIQSYTVTFDRMDGSAQVKKTAQYNTKLAKPADPARTGYKFGGWFKEAACTNAWDFAADKVIKSTTLYAKWTPLSKFTVSAAVNNTAYGSATGAGVFYSGAKVTLKATPKAGYRFVRWLEGANTVSTNPVYTFAVAGNRSLKAEFAKIGTPSLSSVKPSGSKSLKLSWKSVTGVTGYAVCRAASKSGKYATIAKVTAGLTYTDTNLKANQQYYYKIYAYYTADTVTTFGTYSNIVNAKIVLQIPKIKISYSSSAGIKVYWDKISEASKYLVFCAASKNGKYEQVANMTGGVYTNTKIKKGSTYYYKIKACYITGGQESNSGFSNTVSIKAG
jgi:uncharacterized repeat protein (TIGR02543 family)